MGALDSTEWGGALLRAGCGGNRRTLAEPGRRSPSAPRAPLRRGCRHGRGTEFRRHMTADSFRNERAEAGSTFTAAICMLDSYCVRENVALFKSRCNDGSSISGFENVLDGEDDEHVPGASRGRSPAYPTAAASLSPPASPPM